MRIGGRLIAATPFAAVAVETTGLSTRHDRVVEIAIAVVRPGEEPEIVLDSLVHPGRPMAATEIHGITDEDVVGAPTFAEIAEAVVSALSNRVLAAHHPHFDLAMLQVELERCGYPGDLPHVSTRLLLRTADRSSPMLSLRHACLRAGVELEEARAAARDALAAARLLRVQLRELKRRGIRTFDDLRERAASEHAYLASFDFDPLAPPAAIHCGRGLKRRGAMPNERRRAGVAAYLDELVEVLADLHLTEDEVRRIEVARDELGLTRDEVRAVHAKIFWGMLSRYVEDARIDLTESRRLERLHALLLRLGWAPGAPAS